MFSTSRFIMTDRAMAFAGSGAKSVLASSLPPLGTLDQIAHQMTHGFWGDGSHHFDVTQGGTITVDLTALTDSGREVARQALELWSDIIGVNFSESTGGAQITFDDLQQGTGAFSESEWSNGITNWATVNVSLQRLSLHTYLHEIGHALGLGHTANANSGTAAAVYPDDALWRNDGSAISVMSYFDNGENSYYASLGFTNNPVLTPQVADIIAVGNLYGLSTTTRTGNTTYGFNNNSGRDVYSAALHPNAAYTVFDSGGTDTLDYSGFAGSQLVNLNSETFSNVGPGVGNVSIARGVVIENAIGGSGADEIVGNAVDNRLSGLAGNDVLTGNSGNDRLDGGIGDDRLQGGAGSDRLIGEVGIDRLYGGLGDDVYVVSDTTDYAYEYAAEGIDTVFASISHGLRGNIERLELTGTANIYGEGNDLANVVEGNSGRNRLYGRDGDDRLYGRDGNDRIDGGAGVDRMYGGLGNDNYVVSDTTDYAYEAAGEGIDAVYASISHALRANVERLYLTGSAAVDGSGNELANVIIGNAGDNYLRGRGGNDVIHGEGGHDLVNGEDGNDWLEGGAGQDRFYGGSGADRFVFHDGDFAANLDVIHDFSQAGRDQIHLGAVDANTLLGGRQDFALIGTSAFTGSAGELRYEQIGGDTFVQGDTNGDGAADFAIRLDGLHGLGEGDFIF